ncbi:tRNA dihydrouridine(20/20a) synthase DusA [Clostridium folliculivorans]|uniref:tRNA-dihydrouridine(20/20a) synthase n=1 Tax=Clostridium folliculivorans TaxID=2886038 RepID=A0A9W5XZE5_9CLOT|nr:tRNA dihydrouridine(20/20a) synthase DusA [Clostridium folliculivorans]GKU23797.1 tRNA-dihydrouridine(20/20a) synthase [Clostridium folliculivorans]GKU29913.1 tRNA-dihydrouridine(20/20a) synthase [Clostridium folliculivorans]
MNNSFNHMISIAPMVDKTDRHFRYFARLLTKKTLLYTEMITSQAIIHGDRKKLLDFNPTENPVALQIAASNPDELYKAVKIAEDWNYDEINLNAGCPSDRVSGNMMGASLMAYPELIAEMISSMKSATKKPVTVKHRIGISSSKVTSSFMPYGFFNDLGHLSDFMIIINKAAPDRNIIHARIAILEGLSPKENRDIPPLDYDMVYNLKKQFPNSIIEINGGIKTLDEIHEHLTHVDSVMIGREAYSNPAFMARFDSLYNPQDSMTLTRRTIIEDLLPYIEDLESKGENAHLALSHTLGLFQNQPGSSLWKRLLSTPSLGTKSILLRDALASLPQDILDKEI